MEKNLGREIRVEREGIRGNLKEGVILGILERDSTGFYVKMFRACKTEEGISIEKNSFMNEYYTLQNMDVVTLGSSKLSRKNRKIFMQYAIRI